MHMQEAQMISNYWKDSVSYKLESLLTKKPSTTYNVIA